MIRRISFENRETLLKSIDKESPPHVVLCYIKPMRTRRRPDAQVFAKLFLPPLMAILLFAFPFFRAAQARPRAVVARRSVIVDTDAGSDDLMAIAFLLSRPDVRVEAITIVNGMAHVRSGGQNVLRLLELAGEKDVPVFLGRDTPLSGSAEFPAAWRRTSDDLPGITLPAIHRSVETVPAAVYLAKRLSEAARPVQVLALGPLTNLADAFTRAPRAARAVGQIVLMGGAIGVSGNLGDGGAFQTNNTSAEWNIFLDPGAAKTVFASGAPIRVIPLDATQRVRIDMALYEQFQSHAESPLARFVAQVLATNR
ncbi:MAG: nucleoside hydrolase, partial [Candidatus Acidiferrales bacterium]